MSAAKQIRPHAVIDIDTWREVTKEEKAAKLTDQAFSQGELRRLQLTSHLFHRRSTQRKQIAQRKRRAEKIKRCCGFGILALLATMGTNLGLIAPIVSTLLIDWALLYTLIALPIITKPIR